MAYVTDNDTTLVLRTSTDSGASWGSPQTVAQAVTGPLEMPGLAASPSASTVVIVWRDGSSGSWNTMLRSYEPNTRTFTGAVQVSSSSGYASSVRSYHGDYLGVAFVTPTELCVAWSDGRGGLSPDVGFGHVYAAIVPANA